MTRRSAARGLVLPGILTLIVLTALVLLGNWQMDRLAWKEDLIARAAERPSLPPVDVPPPTEWPALDVGALEYRPLRLTGHFLPEREALVFTTVTEPRGRYGGPGYWVVTPFALDGGGTVLVNRGFVPQDRRAPDQRQAPPEGSITVTGLARPNDEPNMFVPDNRPDENLFFSRNIPAIVAAKGIEGPVAPFSIDLPAGAEGVLPQGGETRFSFTNNHLGYAVTWYGLACALVAVFGAFAWNRLTAGRHGEA